MGNAMHYTQIKKSDLNFEPLGEFIIEDGSWLDITLISDSPLLEHDAMYMMQNIERSRHKQLERKAREDRRRTLAAQANISPEEMAAREAQVAAARAKDALAPHPDEKAAPAKEEAEPAKEESESAKDETTTKEKAKPAKSKKKPDDKKKEESDNDDLFVTEEDDDDLF